MSDPSDNGPEFYPDCVTGRPGDHVAIHASAPSSPCSLAVTRIGAETVRVAKFDGIAVQPHAVPADADTAGCDWPEAFRFDIGADWATGYYDLQLTDGDGKSSHHFVCVRPAAGAARADALIVLNTNTYQAYNYWGGANSYAHVTKLMSGELDADASRDGAIGRLSRLRPYAQKLLWPPEGAPRLVNTEPRTMNGYAIPGDLEWMAVYAPTPYDGSAGFVDKWEHAFATWCEREGYRVDYATDHDFESDPGLLDGYAAVFLVGHSEYWSGNQRSALETYVDGGGNLGVFSGNTCYWKVRWEDDDRTLVAHKWKGETDDPLWRAPATRSQATHLWSHPAFGRPEAELTGLSFVYGGYHRLVMCVSRGSSAYTVYDDEHWALEGSDLYYGDTFGGDVPLLGYENDGCPLRFDENGKLAPAGGVGVPDDLQIIAMAPATLFEPPRSEFPPVIPPEQPDVLADIAYGASDTATIARLSRGHAVMASFRRGRGEVFNAGTTEWAHGLAARNPFVERITHNVMRRFGVSPGGETAE